MFDDDFSDATSGQQEASSAAGDKAGAKPARGRGAGGKKGEKRTFPGSTLNCIVPDCPVIRAANSKFCKPHHSCWTTIESQQDDGDEEAQEALKELKERGNDQQRGMAVWEFCQLNPLEQKYMKKQFFSVAHFSKKRYQRTEQRERQGGEKPMTKLAFAAHCKYQLGLPDEERDEWWSELEDNPAIERDNQGHKGKMQLWIPLSKKRERERAKGVEDAVVKSSAQTKNPKKKDEDTMMKFLAGQKMNFSDSFFGMKDADEKAASASSKRKAEPADQSGHLNKNG